MARSGRPVDRLSDQARRITDGVVSDRLEAKIRLRLRGPNGQEAAGDALIDTGFTESLTRPESEATTLGLIRQSGGEARLADGSVRRFDVVGAEIYWGDLWRPVLVSADGHETLVGMRLLAGHELRIVVVPGGLVELTPLPGTWLPD